jgi:signal transduction histidine kinase
MSALLDSTMAATRRIAADLRPLILGDLGLEPALEWLVRDFARRHGVACKLEVAPECTDLADSAASALYRIVQEGLTNVARHACATAAGVLINQRGGEIMLTLQDNGRGFDADAAPREGSYGIKGIRERVYLLGGEVDILSGPGRGTVVQVTFPLPPPLPRTAS